MKEAGYILLVFPVMTLGIPIEEETAAWAFEPEYNFIENIFQKVPKREIEKRVDNELESRRN